VTITAPAGGAVGIPVVFTITATPVAGTAIVSVQIDFGDGTVTPPAGNVTQAQHVYNSAGSYTVTAIATDSAGATASASTIIVVGAGAINPQFTVTPTSPPSGTIATFNASASTATGTIISYSWNFGDTGTGSGVIATHSYTAPGSYIVTLTITDNLGNSKSLAKTLTVT
jgi:PKD repeat protein